MKITKDLHNCINQEITDNDHFRQFVELYEFTCQGAYKLGKTTGSVLKFTRNGTNITDQGVLNLRLARGKAEIDFVLDILSERMKKLNRIE